MVATPSGEGRPGRAAGTRRPVIAEENLEKIFDPLYTTKEHGTGLGLVSCKTIVEQHGGTISVKNNPTTFTVMIPKIIEKVEKDCLV